MKVEWSADDIRAGRVVGKEDRAERWIIGYDSTVSSHDARWALISLTDGMISERATAAALAVKLNMMGELPWEIVQ